MDELNSILEETKALLKKKLDNLPESSFNLWFGEMELDKLDDKSARFTTPSALKQTILATKYAEVIRTSLEEVIGFPIKIEVVYLGNLDKVKKK